MWEFEIGLSDNRMISGLMENLGYEYQGPIYKKVFGGKNHAIHHPIYPVDSGRGGAAFK